MKEKQNLENKIDNLKSQIKLLDLKLQRLEIQKDTYIKQLSLLEEQASLED